jgi:LPS sulfotransferase NodH
MSYRNIALVSTARTGSNWLIRLLNSSRHTNVYGEIGKQDFLKNDSGMVRIANDLNIDTRTLTEMGGALPANLVQELREKSRSEQKVFGCKIFYYHIEDNPWMDAFLRSDQTKVIHLFRNSIFDTYTSLMLARKSGKWHGSQYPELHLRFDSSDYLKFRHSVMDNYNRWSAYLASSKKPEDLVTVEYSMIGKDRLLDILNQFLSVEDLKTPALRKQSTKNPVNYWSDATAIQPYIGDTII